MVVAGDDDGGLMIGCKEDGVRDQTEKIEKIAHTQQILLIFIFVF